MIAFLFPFLPRRLFQGDFGALCASRRPRRAWKAFGTRALLNNVHLRPGCVRAVVHCVPIEAVFVDVRKLAQLSFLALVHAPIPARRCSPCLVLAHHLLLPLLVVVVALLTRGLHASLSLVFPRFSLSPADCQVGPSSQHTSAGLGSMLLATLCALCGGILN